MEKFSNKIEIRWFAFIEFSAGLKGFQNDKPPYFVPPIEQIFPKNVYSVLLIKYDSAKIIVWFLLMKYNFTSVLLLK